MSQMLRDLRRRSVRDWVVDSVAFLFAVGLGLVSINERMDSMNYVVPWLFDVDLVLGVIACLSLWFRRLWPVPITVALVIVTSYFEFPSGALIVAMFTVAVHKKPKTTGIVFALSIAGALVWAFTRREPDVSMITVFIFGALVQGVVVGWGLFIHHRRELLESLRERARRAEAEAQLLAEQSQRRVRDDIAREMHDVLGHRLSLLSVYAGALEFRPDAPATDIAKASGVIRESAHRALQDLRDVIGVLRAPLDELPQPTLADLDTLIAESNTVMPVTFRCDKFDDVPKTLGRNVYRVVQEGLTNVRKHAPDAHTRVTVTGREHEHIEVEVVNDGGGATSSAVTGGHGLSGLDERVALAKGRFEYGPTDDGWRLWARLPWPDDGAQP